MENHKHKLLDSAVVCFKLTTELTVVNEDVTHVFVVTDKASGVAELRRFAHEKWSSTVCSVGAAWQHVH